ncbi:MAG: hypothetical protein K2J32_07430 [Ruminococcus sp.]|nr:hypothetical protein [Ruminococcus sp.]
MKRILSVFLSIIMCLALFSCGGNVDYKDAESFESALNAGEDLIGKTVTFTVEEFSPNSAFGYNLQAGEHLNFCSSENPNAKAGDTVTVKVESVKSVIGSYIIYYKMK